MNKIDIRKIYVCQIEKVTDLYDQQTDEDDVAYLLGRPVIVGKKTKHFYSTDDQDVSLGLFIKTIAGYKHILTGTKYRLAGSAFMSVGEHVINPNSIELFTKRDRALASHLVDKYQSFDMDISVIKALEVRIINNTNYLEDNNVF